MGYTTHETMTGAIDVRISWNVEEAVKSPRTQNLPNQSAQDDKEAGSSMTFSPIVAFER